MHIGACTIYDPSTAPGGKVRLKDIMQFVEDRKHRAKTFTQKLKQVPLDFDRPYWVDDPDFNIEFHIRHIALPHPGDWRQLAIQVARLHARPLDLSKPLWEMTVIEGLDNIPRRTEGLLRHCLEGASQRHRWPVRCRDIGGHSFAQAGRQGRAVRAGPQTHDA